MLHQPMVYADTLLYKPPAGSSSSFRSSPSAVDPTRPWHFHVSGVSDGDSTSEDCSGFCTSSAIWSRAPFNIRSAAAEFNQSCKKVWEVLACRNQFELSFIGLATKVLGGFCS